MWKLNDVISYTTFQRTSIFRLMKTGEFPQGILLSPRRRVWDPAVIKAWVASNAEKNTAK